MGDDEGQVEPDGEPADAGDHEGVPAALIELHEAAEAQRIATSGQGRPTP